MTIRQRKRLVMVGFGVVALALLANVVDALLLRRAGALDLGPFVTLLGIIVLLTVTWGRLRTEEARRGPDHDAPMSRKRWLLVALALVAAVLGALLAIFVAGPR